MDIRVNHIHKKYRLGGKRVLNDISFEGTSGECIGILGANGCGKTTLLSILSGIRKPDGGEFLVDGCNLMKHSAKFNQLIGYVPQGNPLMEELTAKDNLRLWYCDSILNMKEELENGVLKMLGISDFLNVQVSRMSGGMKKRLSIGCAVANNPQILILDEPGASLDLVCKNHIASYLKEFKKKGGIILLATHEEREIDLCDRIYIMKDGMLQETACKNVEQLAQKM